MLIYEYWYDYKKPMYEDKGKLCFKDMEALIFHVKSEDIYANFAEDVGKSIDKENCEEKEIKKRINER